jgi:putative copper resistance protein D
VSPDVTAVAARALAFFCLFQAAGAAFFLALFERRLPRVPGRAGRVSRVCAIAALCGVVLVLLQPPLEASRMAGEFGGLFHGALLRLAWHSRNGAAHGAQLLGLALILVGLRSAHAGRRTLLVLGGVLAAGALVLTGHTSTDPQRALLAPLLLLHLLVVAFWFGALAPLWLTLRHESVADAASVLQGFSRLAAWLVPCIALAGLGMAWLLIDSTAVLRRAYGLLLIAKLCLFVLLMGLASANRWRFLPALAAVPQPMRRALQRSLTAEYLTLLVVLAMTATLTTLFSPED